jgi:hypothetical protein
VAQPPGIAVAYERALRLARRTYVAAACQAAHPDGMLALRRLIALGRCETAGSKCQLEKELGNVSRTRLASPHEPRTEGIHRLGDAKSDERRALQHSAKGVPPNLRRLRPGHDTDYTIQGPTAGGKGGHDSGECALGRPGWGLESVTRQPETKMSRDSCC